MLLLLLNNHDVYLLLSLVWYASYVLVSNIYNTCSTMGIPFPIMIRIRNVTNFFFTQTRMSEIFLVGRRSILKFLTCILIQH